MSEYPTLYEWAGGSDAFDRMINAFYDRVEMDEQLFELVTEKGPPRDRHENFGNLLGDGFQPGGQSARQDGHRIVAEFHD